MRPPPSTIELLQFSLVISAAALAASSPARAELYATSSAHNSVATYHVFNGSPVIAPLVSVAERISGIAVSGEKLFVVKNTSVDLFHSRTGEPIATPLITGLSNSFHCTVSGTDLYVSDYGSNSIRKYTTSGAVQNATLITGLDGPTNVIVSGDRLYVSNNDGDTVGLYATSGAPINPSFISGLGQPGGLAIDQGKLYVVDRFEGKIKVYDAETGALLNPSLAPELDRRRPSSLAIYKNRIYVSVDNPSFIQVYDLSSGRQISDGLSNAFPGVYGSGGFAIKPVPTPRVTIKGTATRRVRSPRSIIRGSATEAIKVLARTGSEAYGKVFSADHPIRHTRARVIRWSYEVDLKEGSNWIKVKAVNSEGVESQEARVRIIKRDDMRVVSPRLSLANAR